MRDLNVGLLGLGTVGGGAAAILRDNAEVIAGRIGRRVVLKRAADLDLARGKALGLAPEMLTAKAEEVLEDPSIDVVVELIGGIEPARTFILKAIENGKHVVTANKKLLAERWEEIFEAAARKGVGVYFEASVGGGIPVIKALREGLASNRITAIYGIINGTSNYILTRMTETGADFATALEEARREGYAEADPSLDVEGIDAAHKLCILSTLAFGARVPLGAVYTEGISRLAPLDIQYAREFGYRIKLLAVAKEADGRVEVRVHPTMVPEGNLLATVGGVYNAIYVKGDAVGATLYYGLGAGRMPTGSAVVSDLMSIAVRTADAKKGMQFRPVPAGAMPAGRLKPVDEAVTSYYIRISALDRPGVLSAVSGVLGRHDISIASVIQKGRREGGAVPIVMMTHEAVERDMRLAIAEIGGLEVIAAPPVVIRVEERF